MNSKFLVWLLATFFLATVSLADAQQAAKVRRIGYLGITSLAAVKINFEAFRQRLRELGWAEGKNITIEYRFSAGRNDLLPEFAKESLPRLSRVAVLWNPDDSGSVINMRGMDAPARYLSLKLQSVEMRQASDLEKAFSTMKRDRAEALVPILGALVAGHRIRIVDRAAKNRLATIFAESQWTEDGGLMSYGANYPDLYRRAAVDVDKILKGTKPADLPVEQPMKFEFIVNLKAAKQIDLTIPPNVLVRADKVIR